MAIQSFDDPLAEEYFYSSKLKGGCGWAQIKSVAKRKLDMVDYAHVLKDLRSPPGNRLVALKKDLKGFHSIRINDQWRVIFCWTETGPTQVRITDYH
jgi:proteic killer suppression protein